MKRFMVLMVLLLCLCVCGLAENEETMQPLPAEINERWLVWEQEGSELLEHGGTEEYYFLLARSGKGENRLYAFSRQHDRWQYWLYTAKAVPQGNGEVHMAFANEGAYDVITGKPFEKPIFSLSQLNEEGEYATVTYTYQMENKAWKLARVYLNEEDNDDQVIVEENKLTFYNNEYEKLGSAKGDFQRDLRHVNISVFPKTLSEAQMKLSFAPEVPYSTQLQAVDVNFTGGLRYPVYTAPDATSYRAANGKAAVSTNSWIQVFGRSDNWILIQYAIDDEQYRFGYISADALPAHAAIGTLQLDNKPGFVTMTTVLTDDPLRSGSALRTLQQGSPVTWLATLGNWAYVESRTGDMVRGFIPLHALTADHTFYLNNHTDVSGQRYPLNGVLTISAKGQVTLTVTEVNCTANGEAVQAFALYNMVDGQKILTAKRNDNGTYPGTATFTGAAQAFLLVPVDAQGREDRTQAIFLQQ